MSVFPFMQPVQNCEENKMLKSLKNLITNAFLSMLHRLHERRYQLSPFSHEGKKAYIIFLP